MARYLTIDDCKSCVYCTMDEKPPFCFRRWAQWAPDGPITEAAARERAKNDAKMAYWVAKADFEEK